MTNIPILGKKIPIIGAKGMEERETATAEEATVAIMIQQGIFRMLDQSGQSRQVQVNTVIQTLATMSAALILPRDRTEEAWQEAIAEAFRRIFDAAASMEDWLHRGVEWKPQSATVKNAERGGGGVTLKGSAKPDGKPS